MPLTQLIVLDGRLHLPNETILLCIYEAGDCDSIHWPAYDADGLHQALYDCYETGELTGERSVLLPDGSRFDIDA